eukprot:Blabericola_migrator_1__7516@NODE_383_length_9140_cov_403_746611_g306_i0_p1_GENE_NODE_383_length_9140_cov_403_746611_g306_i0NODE_383_length_9140_cov_403_746611_g306_i0_p1_ORF_typecomplete_len1131_score160_64MINDY_DUB/PF04424_13/1_2e03MINDY_DUB/PF04424_13/0_43FANCI_S2/PF14676_6/24FANCI_S2/PF14676_6/6_2FANCI_S2/PF14676_6/1e03FANCI_S2/PF14676_6/7_7e03FANCI_S2/PF14676_6/1_5e04FANCI_S2/PF14676_6/7_6e03_NODE_383_length_9140_cov_403_746611_g306_i032696661
MPGCRYLTIASKELGPERVTFTQLVFGITSILSPGSLVNDTVTHINEACANEEASESWKPYGVSPGVELITRNLDSHWSEWEYEGLIVQTPSVPVMMLHRAIAQFAVKHPSNEGIEHLALIILGSVPVAETKCMAYRRSSTTSNTPRLTLEELRTTVLNYITNMTGSELKAYKEMCDAPRTITKAQLISFFTIYLNALTEEMCENTFQNVLVSNVFRVLEYFCSHHLPRFASVDQKLKHRIRTQVLMYFGQLSAEARTFLTKGNQVRPKRIQDIIENALSELGGSETKQAVKVKESLIHLLESTPVDMINKLIGLETSEFALSERDYWSGFAFIDPTYHKLWKNLYSSGALRMPIPDYETAVNHVHLKAHFTRHLTELGIAWDEGVLLSYAKFLHQSMREFVERVEGMDTKTVDHLDSFIRTANSDVLENTKDIAWHMLNILKSLPAQVVMGGTGGLRNKGVGRVPPTQFAQGVVARDIGETYLPGTYSQRRAKLFALTKGSKYLTRLVKELPMSALISASSQRIDLRPFLLRVIDLWRLQASASVSRNIDFIESIIKQDSTLVVRPLDERVVSQIVERYFNNCAPPRHIEKALIDVTYEVKALMRAKTECIRHFLPLTRKAVTELSIFLDTVEKLQLSKPSEAEIIEDQLNCHLASVVRSESQKDKTSLEITVSKFLTYLPLCDITHFIRRLQKACDLRIFLKSLIPLDPRQEIFLANMTGYTLAHVVLSDTKKPEEVFSLIKRFLVKVEGSIPAAADLVSRKYETLLGFSSDCAMELQALREFLMKRMGVSIREVDMHLHNLIAFVIDLPESNDLDESGRSNTDCVNEASAVLTKRSGGIPPPRETVRNWAMMFCLQQLNKASSFTAQQMRLEQHKALSSIINTQAHLGTDFTPESLQTFISILRAVPDKALYAHGKKRFAMHSNLVSHIVSAHLHSNTHRPFLIDLINAHVAYSLSVCVANTSLNSKTYDAMHFNHLLLNWLLQCPIEFDREMCRLAVSIHRMLLIAHVTTESRLSACLYRHWSVPVLNTPAARCLHAVFRGDSVAKLYKPFIAMFQYIMSRGENVSRDDLSIACLCLIFSNKTVSMFQGGLGTLLSGGRFSKHEVFDACQRYHNAIMQQKNPDTYL